MPKSKSLPVSLSDLINDPVYTVEQKIAKLRKAFMEEGLRSSNLPAGDSSNEHNNSSSSPTESPPEVGGLPLAATLKTRKSKPTDILTQSKKSADSPKRSADISSKSPYSRKKKTQLSSPQYLDSSHSQVDSLPPTDLSSKSDQSHSISLTKKGKKSFKDTSSEPTSFSTSVNNEDAFSNSSMPSTEILKSNSFIDNSLLNSPSTNYINDALQRETPDLIEDSKKLIPYVFDCIYSNVFSRFLLEPGYGLTSEEVKFHQNKLTSVDELFKNLNSLLKKHQQEISETVSKNSDIYKRTVDFNDYLQNLKQELRSPSSDFKDYQPVSAFLKNCGSIELNSESTIYFIRISNGEKIMNKGYNVNEVYYLFHQSLFSWIKRKLRDDSFDIITDKIKMLDISTNVVFRLYISSSRNFITDCIEDPNACLLLNLSIGSGEHQKHFVLALKPIGKLSSVAVDTTCNLEKLPKAWVWVKVIRVVQICSEFQIGKTQLHKPILIGNCKQGMNQSKFKDLCKLFSEHIIT